MKFFNFNKDKKEDNNTFAIGLSSGVAKVELPQISETRRNEWVDYEKIICFLLNCSNYI